MKEIKETLMIVLKNEVKVPIYVAKLIYTVRKDESFSYEFIPNYKTIDLLTNLKSFQGIPGLNLDLRKESYIRENIIPTYISERVPPKNRENLYELLDEVGLEYYDPILYLLRTKYQYFGDEFYNLKEEKLNQTKNYESINDLGKNLKTIYYNILKEMGKGNNLIFKNFKIDETNYQNIYNLILESLIKMEKPLLESKNKAGRKRKEIDNYQKDKVLKAYLNKEINSKEASLALNISESTFYRILRAYKKRREN